jgi:hypothetical protein
MVNKYNKNNTLKNEAEEWLNKFKENINVKFNFVKNNMVLKDH